MASTKPLPATDSAADLRRLTGDDATAEFESDANFVDSNPGAEGSSENVEEQRDTDDLEDSDEEIEDADEIEDDDVEEVVAASAAVMWADGLLGQEYEQEDAAKKRDRSSGDKARAREAGEVVVDDDAGDVDMGVDEDALDDDDMDTDKVAAAAYVPFELVMSLMDAGSSIARGV